LLEIDELRGLALPFAALERLAVPQVLNGRMLGGRFDGFRPGLVDDRGVCDLVDRDRLRDDVRRGLRDDDDRLLIDRDRGRAPARPVDPVQGPNRALLLLNRFPLVEPNRRSPPRIRTWGPCDRP
jgi:hypothetical protein